MLRLDQENENETIARYRQRVRRCEALEEYAMAEQIRSILVQEIEGIVKDNDFARQM